MIIPQVQINHSTIPNPQIFKFGTNDEIQTASTEHISSLHHFLLPQNPFTGIRGSAIPWPFYLSIRW